jgi:hypothetical protein
MDNLYVQYTITFLPFPMNRQDRLNCVSQRILYGALVHIETFYCVNQVVKCYCNLRIFSERTDYVDNLL